MPTITKISSAVIQANFHWTYVRIFSDCDGGLYGTGECFFAPGLPQIIQEFESVLLGEDFNNIEKLVEKMRWSASGTGSIGGIIWNAISGIEAALWDLKGKYLGVPVWQLLGGKFRDEARIYVDCHAEEALSCLSPLLQPQPTSWSKAAIEMSAHEVIAASAERAAQVVAQGYAALKFDLDLPGSTFDSATGYSLRSSDIDWMVALTSAIRQAVGPNVDLAMDAHWRYRPSDIIQVAKQLEPFRLMWLEDPVPPHDEKSLANLRQHTTTPIGTGENLQLRSGFWNLIIHDLCDVVTPDVQKAGGLAETKKIADLCTTANKAFAPHMIGSPLALMATAHVSLTVPTFLVCEFHGYGVPFFHDLVDGGTASWFFADKIKPLDTPGYGVELDEDVAKRYRVAGSAWFE